jgi:cell division protein FtsZ
VSRAFRKALHSPLLNDNDIYKSKKILFNIYENPNTPIRVEEMAEVESFMSQFTDENIELIWGYSKDNSLEDGQVKVTVLATGFGMKNIPGMEPEVKAIEEEQNAITRQRKEEIEKENIRLSQMANAFYKPDYKMYVFKGEEMYNDEFLAALDNSPTYKRTAQELESMISIIGNEVQEISTPTANESTENNVVTEEDNGDNDDSIGQTVFSKEFN